MGLARCSRCSRAFRSVRWVDRRSGELATAQALLDGETVRLCWDCQAAIREEVEDKTAEESIIAE